MKILIFLLVNFSFQLFDTEGKQPKEENQIQLLNENQDILNHKLQEIANSDNNEKNRKLPEIYDEDKLDEEDDLELQNGLQNAQNHLNKGKEDVDNFLQNMNGHLNKLMGGIDKFKAGLNSIPQGIGNLQNSLKSGFNALKGGLFGKIKSFFKPPPPPKWIQRTRVGSASDIKRINSSLAGQTFKFHYSENFPEKPTIKINNPLFDPSFHKRNLDYFFLTIPVQLIANALNRVNVYLQHWMKINPTQELLIVKPKIIRGNKLRNLFEAEYLNKVTFLKKRYIFFIDYGYDSVMKNYSETDPVNIKGLESDSSYNTNFDYTLQTDCQAIQKYIKNPDEIKCSYEVDDQNNFIPHVYNVKAVYKRQTDEVRRFKFLCVSDSQTGGAITSKKSPPTFDPLKGKFIYKQFIDKFKTMKKVIKNSILISDFKSSPLPKKIRIMEKKLRRKRNKTLLKVKFIDRDYQKTIRETLVGAAGSGINDQLLDQKTAKLIRDKCDEVNGFNLELALKKAQHRQSYDHNYQAYFIRRKAWLDEKLSKLYLADRDLDLQFYQQVTSEGREEM